MSTFKEWMKERYDRGELEDITNHGCVSGFPGLTYYSDTHKLYYDFSEEIWDALSEDADSFGNKNIMELIASFNGADAVGSDGQFENLLVWYMAERIARELIEESEDDTEDN